MQVLIIDNDIAYRNGVSMAASNKHWIPVSCGDIRTAKQIISSTLPDLIISDCLLYGETVIDLLENIQIGSSLKRFGDVDIDGQQNKTVTF